MDTESSEMDSLYTTGHEPDGREMTSPDPNQLDELPEETDRDLDLSAVEESAEEVGVESAAWIPGQGVFVDHAAIIDIMVEHLLEPGELDGGSQKSRTDARVRLQTNKYSRSHCDGSAAFSHLRRTSWFPLRRVSFQRSFLAWHITCQSQRFVSGFASRPDCFLFTAHTFNRQRSRPTVRCFAQCNLSRYDKHLQPYRKLRRQLLSRARRQPPSTPRPRQWYPHRRSPSAYHRDSQCLRPTQQERKKLGTSPGRNPLDPLRWPQRNPSQTRRRWRSQRRSRRQRHRASPKRAKKRPTPRKSSKRSVST